MIFEHFISQKAFIIAWSISQDPIGWLHHSSCVCRRTQIFSR